MLLVAAVTVLAGCSNSNTHPAAPSTSSNASAAGVSPSSTAKPTPPSVAPLVPAHAITYPTKPLRAGERFQKVGIPTPYTPSAAVGTDDYRCFLIDPHLAKDAYLTGVTFEPDQVSEVHHAILYRVDPNQVAGARRMDAQTPGQGWSCFGSAGLDAVPSSNGANQVLNDLQSAPWLAAWAPGGKEQLYAKGVGVVMKARSQIVLQVHYNLLGGSRPDHTSVRLRLASNHSQLKPLMTMLLPAPVELPCTPTEHGPLCDRTASILDLERRFGAGAGTTVAGLQLLCGGNLIDPRAGPTQSCDRTIQTPMTIQATAGHMHLLGKSIKITIDPGRADAHTILDIPVWDFDNQGAQTLPRPVTVEPGQTIRVTCTHDASLHQKLPSLRNLPPRYVTWGDGSTDEMCLGIVLYTAH